MPHLKLFNIAIVLCVAAGCATELPPPTPVFDPQVIDPDVEIGYGLGIGDVDGDGDDDILLADKKQFVWYRNSDWQRFVMVDSLTARDNVSIAVRDINNDGQVEVAVGAMWNPGETSDASLSGSVHYLIRPEDPTQRWTPVQLPHEPTVHRMHWVPDGAGGFDLVVLPLHGRGNSGGEGAGVRVIAYTFPEDPESTWATEILDDQMHMTHNFDLIETASGSDLYIAGREGVRKASVRNGAWSANRAAQIGGLTHGAGEVRVGTLTNENFITTIESMHGTSLVAYIGEDDPRRVVLDSTFAEGHGLATGDLLGLGRDQIVAGWRRPDARDRVGIRMYVPDDEAGTRWTTHIIDDNTMATEDVKLADLDADGKLDIIAAGRATNNLIIYWNRTP